MNITDGEQPVNEFYPADVVNDVLGDYPATTTLIDTIFIPSKRVPKELLDQFVSDRDALNDAMLANIPLLQHTVKQPYWKTGANQREFDAVTIQAFAAVCLSEDRHCLELIVASSAMYRDLSAKTLRQAIQAADDNFELEMLSEQYRRQLDQKIFTSIYDYYLVDLSKLCRLLNISNQKKNRLKIQERLRRLGLMELVLQPEKDGQPIHKRRHSFHLVDGRTLIPLLCLDRVRSKSQIADDTFTHMIVGVDKSFTASLKPEGAIPRKRFLDVYPRIAGNQATDFLKYLDTHSISYLHGKELKVIVSDYISRKAKLPKKYLTTQIRSITNEVVAERKLLIDKFGLMLVERENDKGSDWILVKSQAQEVL